MKKNKIYKVMKAVTACMLLTPFFLTVTGCSDQLNELPSQSKVDGNLVVDQRSAMVALNGIYYTFAMCGTDYYDVKSTRCSQWYEIIPADFAGTAIYYQGAYLLETHNAISLSRYGSYLWDSFFGTLNAANTVIDQVGDAPDSYFTGNKKNEILGEAYAMRALSFYNILRFYGYSWDVNSPYGVILRTKQSKATTLPLERSNVKDTYEQIISDLDFAIANAPAQNEPYYMTSWAAKALKARVLMMRGQGNDYQDAATLCADIINNGPYALEDNYADIFHVKGLKSAEVIFGIQPKENQSDVKESYYYRNSAQYFPTDNLLALYENDPRKEQMFKGEPAEQIGIRDDGSYYIYYDDKYTICKHINPLTFATDELEETQYQIRLSEVYLLRAEALARTGNLTEAGSLLKTVMSKAGITDFSAVDAATTQEAMMQQIFNEGIKNLSFECGLEHDLMLRFPESITLKFNPAYAQKEYNVFAIPSDEFKYNNKLTEADQNPGFSVSQ